MVTQVRSCISADLDCADICATTARVLSRQAGYDASITRALLLVCINACRSGYIRHYTYVNVQDRSRMSGWHPLHGTLTPQPGRAPTRLITMPPWPSASCTCS
jgi:hypothetical protein